MHWLLKVKHEMQFRYFERGIDVDWLKIAEDVDGCMQRGYSQSRLTI